MVNRVNPEAGRKAGRPRSEEARRAILRAALSLLQKNGLAGVTVEGVAAASRVGKPTIYRHFGNRHELAMAALMELSTEQSSVEPDADPLCALKQHLFAIAALFESPTGRFVTTVLASGHGETEISKAFRSHFVQARRESGRALLQSALERGEIGSTCDPDVVVDELYGAIFYRMLMGHAPVNTEFVSTLFAQVMNGIRD